MGVINLNEQLKALEPQQLVITNSEDINAFLSIVGKLVVLTVSIAKASSATLSIGTLPEKYRPTVDVTGAVGARYYSGWITVSASDGAIQATFGTSGFDYYGQLIWTI